LIRYHRYPVPLKFICIFTRLFFEYQSCIYLMNDIATRCEKNPLLSPSDLIPSMDGLTITCLLNPGVFTFEDKTWLLVRVAERPAQQDGFISFPVLSETGIKIKDIRKDDPDLIATDARIVQYKKQDYLTTLSHLRLLCSDNGEIFYEPEGYSPISGKSKLEFFGIEDCRVSKIEDTFYLTYTAVSESGVGVGLSTTTDWKNFHHHGMILPPHNKDCTLFEEKINGKFYAFHRPSSVAIGGNFIWLAESPDGLHWGNHQCLINTREGFWDSERVGAGAAPIKTKKGWLQIYHGANAQHQYCLGALLLDINLAAAVLARSIDPIMVPSASYELTGFFGNVVFTNGHIVKGYVLTIYYGASDEFVCKAEFSIEQILNSLAYKT